jgi:hypothetical protein
MPGQTQIPATADDVLRPADAAPHTEPRARRPYPPPRLEPLGAWSALTLQQSIPIFP